MRRLSRTATPSRLEAEGEKRLHDDAGRQRRRHAQPRVQHAVNSAPEYAALRRVYLSRIAAEWYRRHVSSASLDGGTGFGGGVVGRWMTPVVGSKCTS